MKLRRTAALIAISTAVGACTPPLPPKPPRTQLEIRQDQTRDYDTADTRLVMKALLNVLQDDGFIVKNAVVELGLITASKELDVEPAGGNGSFFSGLSFGGGIGRGSGFGWGFGPELGHSDDGPRSKNTIIEASANVSELGRRSRVRINFQRKTVDNRGGALEVRQIEDAEFYRDFFMKVDKGLFLQREKL